MTQPDNRRPPDSDAEAVADRVVDEPADLAAKRVGEKVDPAPPGTKRSDGEPDSTALATAAELDPTPPASDLIPAAGGPADPIPAAGGPASRSVQGMFGANTTGDTSGYGRLKSSIAFPVATSRPLGEGETAWFDTVVDRLAELIPGYQPVAVVHRGELTLHVPREQLLEVAKTLRDDAVLRFEFCPSVSGVHYPHDVGRELHAVIHLVSMTHNRRIRVEVSVPDSDPHLPSVVPIYPAADWHERETWDMFGIIFDGHPALTRILMPDDWPGHPQRKDYPLGGIEVEYKGATVPPPDQRRSYH